MIFSNIWSRFRSWWAEPQADDTPPLIDAIASQLAKVWQLPRYLAKALKYVRHGLHRLTCWIEALSNDCGIVIVVWSGSHRKPIVIDLRGKRRRSAGHPSPGSAVRPDGGRAPHNNSPTFKPGGLL